MLIVTLIENITSEGKHSKYIKYISAVIFLLTIINPLVSFLKDPKTDIETNLSYNIQTAVSTGINEEQIYANLLNGEYTDNLQRDIYEKIKEKYPEFTGEVEVITEENYDSESFGTLLGVNIYTSSNLNKQTVENIINSFYSENSVNININVFTEVD